MSNLSNLSDFYVFYDNFALCEVLLVVLDWFGVCVVICVELNIFNECAYLISANIVLGVHFIDCCEIFEVCVPLLKPVLVAFVKFAELKPIFF